MEEIKKQLKALIAGADFQSAAESLQARGVNTSKELEIIKLWEGKAEELAASGEKYSTHECEEMRLQLFGNNDLPFRDNVAAIPTLLRKVDAL